MQNNFDRLLKNKIKDTFNQHNEPFINDDWLKMKEKLKKEKDNKAALLILWGKAASIAVLVAITAIIFYTIGENSANKTIQTTQNLCERKYGDNIKICKVNYNSNVEIKVNSTNNSLKSSQNLMPNNNIRKEIENQNFANNTDQNNIFTDETPYIVDSLIADNDSIANDSLYVQEVNNIDTFIANLFPEQIIEPQENRQRKLEYGISMSSASYLSNYTSPSSVSFSAGIETSYDIANNFSINSGVILSHQSVAIEDFNYDYSDNSLANNTYNTANVFDQPSSTNTFVAIDIPVNVQVKLKNTYITTGFSSLAYIYEKSEFTFNETVYNSQTNNYEINTVSNSTQNFLPKQNNIDLAKIINFSVGYQVPLKKGSLIFEPYIKYPISEITPQNIRFSTGGLSLQYRFGK